MTNLCMNQSHKSTRWRAGGLVGWNCNTMLNLWMSLDKWRLTYPIFDSMIVTNIQWELPTLSKVALPLCTTSSHNYKYTLTSISHFVWGKQWRQNVKFVAKRLYDQFKSLPRDWRESQEDHTHSHGISEKLQMRCHLHTPGCTPKRNSVWQLTWSWSICYYF